jgi:hypothetical protein
MKVAGSADQIDAGRGWNRRTNIAEASTYKVGQRLSPGVEPAAVGEPVGSVARSPRRAGGPRLKRDAGEQPQKRWMARLRRWAKIALRFE